MKVGAVIILTLLISTLATLAGVYGRSLWQAPQSLHAARLEKADRRLAELDAAAPFPPPAVLESQLARVSARGNGPGRSVQHMGPAITATLIAFVGFAIWVGSTVLLVRRGMDGRVARRGFRHGGRIASGWVKALLPVLLVLGFALFLAGLRSA